MKRIYTYLTLIVVLFVSTIKLNATPAVTATITNFLIFYNGDFKFSFDIYVLRTTPAEDFRMGTSTFAIKFTPGAFANPVLSNINPKYSTGSPSRDYGPMTTFTVSNIVLAQINYTGGGLGTGESITSIPGPSGFGERVTTITMDALMIKFIYLIWDLKNSAIVDPLFNPPITTYIGAFIAPVELSSFASSINKNIGTLNWTTVSETNNSGFEIQRKSIVNSEWSRVGFVQGNGTTTTPKNYSYVDRRLSTGKYKYRLKQIDYNGNFEYFNLSNEVEIGIPKEYSISQNYPNPFNPTTKIDYEIPNDGIVSITIYDITGRELRKLVNEIQTAGYYTIEFNANDLSSGMYFYRINAENFIATKKMMLIK